MKHACEGYRGWWDGPCPSANFVLAQGESFTVGQVASLTLIAGVMFAIILALIVMGIMVTSSWD